MEIAQPLFVLILVVGMCSLPAYGLKRPWKGLCLAWSGAFLGAGFSLGAAWLYIKFIHVQYTPRNDSDWSGVGAYILWFFAVPCVGAIAGLILGYKSAYWLERKISQPPPLPPFQKVTGRG